jgi:hypothetical protein
MSEHRKKPGVAFWATVVVACLLLYPISFGPACWVFSHVASDEDNWPTLDFIYAPILRVWRYHDGIIPDAIEWYGNVGSAVEVQAATETNAKDGDRSVYLVRVP